MNYTTLLVVVVFCAVYLGMALGRWPGFAPASLATLVALTLAGSNTIGHVPIGFGQHAKCGVPMTLLSLAFAFAWLPTRSP